MKARKEASRLFSHGGEKLLELSFVDGDWFLDNRVGTFSQGLGGKGRVCMMVASEEVDVEIFGGSRRW